MLHLLSNLPVGVKATIEDYLPDAPLLKLYEMGCIPGEKIMLHHRAPFGGPLDIEVAGYHLCLRKSEAGKIRVRLIV
jgi:ferrous iron transport protein A